MEEDNDVLYKGTLIAFMSWRDETAYEKDHEFTQEHLAGVTASEVAGWFKLKVYGTDTPGRDDRPVHGRAHSLLHYKKSLSWFMPNRNHTWNEMTNVGNPTRSQEVNDVINRVKKFETRHQGAPSKTRRPLKEGEFRSMITELRENDDIFIRFGVTALLAFQFHLIGRVDCCSKWLRQNLVAHDAHPDKAAKVRLSWSKNVREERDAPWQHLFGSMDFVFCVLLNLGLWLEVFHGHVPDGRHRPFVFGFTEELNPEKAGDKTKSFVYRVLRPLFTQLGINLEHLAGLVGSHSVRKLAATWVRGNGISKDDKDYRGRWKRKRVSDVYDDVQLDWVDAKVAAVLCPGGVVNYVVIDEACTDEWIVNTVTPNINDVFGFCLALLFGKPILWLAMSEHFTIMPHDMADRIREA